MTARWCSRRPRSIGPELKASHAAPDATRADSGVHLGLNYRGISYGGALQLFNRETPLSRAGYSDDGGGGWRLIMWRGAVASAIRGARGQAFLKEMLGTLDAMPEKRLISEELITKEGEVCAIGSVGKARGLPMENLDVQDYDGIAAAFGISQALVREIEYENDDYWHTETPEHRWERVRRWVVENIKP